jgi:hypothetical protein
MLLPTLLQDDARLQAKVSLAVKDQPLRNVLSALGTQIQVRLTASADTADDKITLFLDARPAAEVLVLLARHYRFRWLRTRRGYELQQEAAARQHEAALREADREAEWTELRRWVARLEQLVGTSRVRLRERAKEISRRLDSTDLAAAERSRLTTEAAAIRDALRPETPAAVAILRSLTPMHVERLQKERNLRLSCPDGSLSAHILELLPETDAGGNRVPPEEQVSADADIQWMEGIRGTDFGPLRPGDRRATLLVRVIWLGEQGTRGRAALHWSPLLPPKEKAVAPVPETEDPELLRPVELAVPLPRRGNSSTGRAVSAFSETVRFWPAWPTLGAVAQALHEATRLEVLADSFVRCRVDPKSISGRQPVVQILDTLARELDYTWKKEGKLLVLRSRTYFWDRELEVPERIVHPWQARAARADAVPLDALAELAATLEDLQTLGMSLYWGWYLEEPLIAPPWGGPTVLHHRRHHLRFWASLQPAQRQQARQGALIPVAPMSAIQRRAFVTALTDPTISPHDEASTLLRSERGLTPAELLAGSFSVKTEEWRMQLFLGMRANGEEEQLSGLYPSDRPPDLSKLPKDVQWSLTGPPSGVTKSVFAYYLAGEQKPARTAVIGVIRPRTAR